MYNQPIGKVEWLEPKELRANDYNPNQVFPPELKLLKISIMSDGWTQPIVVREIVTNNNILNAITFFISIILSKLIIFLVLQYKN